MNLNPSINDISEAEEDKEEENDDLEREGPSPLIQPNALETLNRPGSVSEVKIREKLVPE